ncbi:MAG: hypothetical protein ACYC6V_05325 [Bacillota bacterium]
MPKVNAVPDFLSFWDEAAFLAPPLQALAWEKVYYEPYHQVFDLYFTRWGERARLQEAMTRYPAVIDRVKALSHGLSDAIDEVTVQVSSHLAAVAAVDVIAFIGVFGEASWSWPVFSRPAALVTLESFTDLGSARLALAHEVTHAVAANAVGLGFSETQRYQGDLLFNLVFDGLAGLVSSWVCPGFGDATYLWRRDGRANADRGSANDRLAWCAAHRRELARAYAEDGLNDGPEVIDRYYGPNGDFMGQILTGRWLALQFARETFDQSSVAAALAAGIRPLRETAAVWLRRAAR